MIKMLLPSALLLTLASTVSAETTINLTSQPGDYIGQGRSYQYNDENSLITFKRNYDNGIGISIANLPGEPSLRWSWDMAAAGNTELQVGAYEGAERFPFQAIENPGLSFSGDGRGCNRLTGSFEIYEVAYDGGGNVTALNAKFEQHCEGVAAALKGDISFNTVQPVGVSAIGLGGYQVICKNRTTGQRVFKKMTGEIFDCKKLGLDINTGDDVQVRIRGIAE